MTNKEIYEIAIKQSAAEYGCAPSDFAAVDNVVTVSRKRAGARKYFETPAFCALTSYGNNVAATGNEALTQELRNYVDSHPVHRSFEMRNINLLNETLKEYGKQINFMADMFLPDVRALKKLPCRYETKILLPQEFAELYTDDWHNALNASMKESDMLAIGAYDEGRLIGLSGCSADCDTMWQIGIDVLPDYRRQGVASALTSALAIEIIQRGKVPFYGCVNGNIASHRNALKSGFRYTWVEASVK